MNGDAPQLTAEELGSGVWGGVGEVTWGGGQSWRFRRQGLAGSAVPAAFIKPGLSDPPLPALLSSLEGWEGMGRDAGSRDGGDGCTEPRDLPGRCQDKWGTRTGQEGGKCRSPLSLPQQSLLLWDLDSNSNYLSVPA